jgi:hypothetical protein
MINPDGTQPYLVGFYMNKIPKESKFYEWWQLILWDLYFKSKDYNSAKECYSQIPEGSWNYAMAKTLINGLPNIEK